MSKKTTLPKINWSLAPKRTIAHTYTEGGRGVWIIAPEYRKRLAQGIVDFKRSDYYISSAYNESFPKVIWQANPSRGKL
jgi:hypothetical protein